MDRRRAIYHSNQKRLRSTNPCVFLNPPVTFGDVRACAYCPGSLNCEPYKKTLSNRHLQKGGALPRTGAKYIQNHKTYPIQKSIQISLAPSRKTKEPGSTHNIPNELNPDRGSLAANFGVETNQQRDQCIPKPSFQARARPEESTPERDSAC